MQDHANPASHHDKWFSVHELLYVAKTSKVICDFDEIDLDYHRRFVVVITLYIFGQRCMEFSGGSLNFSIFCERFIEQISGLGLESFCMTRSSIRHLDARRRQWRFWTAAM
jgi:hypothetical protein